MPAPMASRPSRSLSTSDPEPRGASLRRGANCLSLSHEEPLRGHRKAMKIRFHRYAPERAFRSLSDFARYANKQSERFLAIEESTPDALWWAHPIGRNWKNVAARADSGNADAAKVQRLLLDSPAFPFESALTKRLRLITDQGRKSAVDELLPFLKGQRDRLNGASLNVPQLDAHSEFIAALTSDTVSKFGAPGAAFSDVLAEHEERLHLLLVANEDELEKGREAFEGLIEEARQKFDDLARREASSAEDRGAQWLATHNDYVEQLATETAVDLWSKRSTQHLKRYKGFRTWSIGFGAVGLIITLFWIFGGFATARAIFPSDKTAQIASYSAGSIALFTLFVWGLRVLIRSMMSEDHLATDASARSALAHTYLALTKQEAATKEDRAIILASLFAPVSDGLVKDDGMPALSPTGMAAQILTQPGIR